MSDARLLSVQTGRTAPLGPDEVPSAFVKTARQGPVAVMRLGLRFGPDIGFIGFDELEWAPLVGPGLTTIAQPTDALGRLAARCLIERLQGSPSPPRQILLSGELVVRGSSRRDAAIAPGQK